MKIKANLLNKPVNFQMDDCQIEKVVELPRDQFSALALIIRNASPFCKVWKAKYTCLPEKGAFLLKRYRFLFCRQTGACLLSYFSFKISIISGS